MSTPSEPEHGRPEEGVNLDKGDPAGEAPFDPYRFGKPDHPIPAEYAPPGYTGPVIPSGPYARPQPWDAPTPPSQPDNPFNNPPGTPYTGHYQPYQYPPPPPGQYPGGPPGQYPGGPPGQYPGGPPGQHYGPPPPPYHGYVPPRTGNGKGIAALVLGIASIVFFWLFFFDAIFVVLGLIFAIIALSESKAAGGTGRGMAIAGLVCSIIGALLATVITVVVIHAANQCGGFSSSDQTGWRTCIRHHLG